MPISVQRWSDRESWNNFVASTPHAHFQQSWEWGELAPDLGGTAVRLAAVEAGELVGAAQVFVNPVARVGRTYLYVPRGPAISAPRIDVLGPLLDEMRTLALDHQALALRLEPNAPAADRELSGVLRSLGLHPTYPPSQPRSSWVLDIELPADELLAGMKSKTRYNIRLASRKGVEVRAAGPEDLDEFYRLFSQTAERDDFFIHSIDLYRRMYDLFRSAGAFRMLMAYWKGQAIAAVTLVRFGETCWYLQGASSNEHRNLMAPYLLQWEAIEWAKEQGCSLYDFRAVPDILRPDQDMFGVYRFKEGFGGRQYTTLDTYTAGYSPTLFGLWQMFFTGRFMIEQVRRRRRGLPARQFA